ncbi:hypothetical protein [Actinokineospora globicatena]|uniref:hypothetical protein n=1 Tax=Actinokineospora globicatena TaxID=103729 RepID=UPI0020A495E2|nr:hypothetical protein [Actinokineospora globicatena]MCP2305072.1 hypothetical protein [Actinokineospora globicatena]GLW80537.1 hypothetical protein Aglo01_50180 [Actinokineospora globicatena]GLW87365.1 hypothetical protein Aglo02_50040 [Actinokineospora globicatena]
MVTDDRLRAALTTGPFSLALRLALRASGLSLDRVQYRLAEREVPVSKTALSNWQSGRTQPERAESLRALAVLEEILGLPERALSALLGPPRPRGRWLTRAPNDMRADQAWARPDGLLRTLDSLGTTLAAVDRMSKVSVQVVCVVGADRVLHRVEHLVVLRAEQAGVDRYTVAYRSDLGEPEITAMVGCRQGRRRGDRETGFTTFELLLDRGLDAGELVTLAYTMAPGSAELYHSQRVGASTRVYGALVQFDSGALPVRVYRRFQSSVGETGCAEIDVRLGAAFTAQHVESDPALGIYRIGWDWD